jgi:hypothetical protein
MSDLEHQCKMAIYLLSIGKKVWSDKVLEDKMAELGNPLYRVDDMDDEFKQEAKKWYKNVRKAV